MSKLPLNTSMHDIVKLLEKDPSKLSPILDQFNDVEELTPDLDTFEYTALTPDKLYESFWVIRLGHMGANGSENQPGT